MSLTVVNGEGEEVQRDIRAGSNVESQCEENNLRSNVDYKKAEFDSAEEEIMECMITLIEEGEADSLYSKISAITGIEEEAVMGIIHSIRQKMIQNKIVKRRKNGYEFSQGDSEDFEL
ncbi:MAG: hypothetical protein HFJ54_03135 [Clostridia bacterium]|nr:hypothetical protein [Clostridia bacterium]